VSGPISSNTQCSRILVNQSSSHDELFLLLQRFWEIDTIPNIQDYTLSVEDQQCEDHFKQTHSRDRDGRYIVRLPFKEDPAQLGSF